jgi:hypothetical protein
VEAHAARIAAGEDRDRVITELAMEIVELEDGLSEISKLKDIVETKNEGKALFRLYDDGWRLQEFQ